VKATAAAIAAAATLTACPAYGIAVRHCMKTADCPTGETCDTQTMTCEFATTDGGTDGGP
jgi:hypothetical protein